MTDSLDRADPSGPSGDTDVSASGHREILPRRLGVVALVALIVAWNAPVAAMAGFQQLAIGVGNGIGAPITFLVAGVVLLIFAVGFVAMSRHSPNPGAYYRYVVDGLGRPAGLAAAFLATVAYIVFVPGTLLFLGLIFTDMTNRLFGHPVGNWQVWAIVSILIITALGLLRVDLSMRVIGTLVVVEVIIVALWEGAILIKGGPAGYSTESFSPSSVFSGSPGLAVLFAMLTMIGIETCACFRNEARDPERSVARATYIGIIYMMVFYAVGSWVYIISQGDQAVEVSSKDPVGSFFNSIDTYLGSFFVTLTSVILVTSQLAATNALMAMASRYLHALGRDRSLPKQLARVHPRLESPYVAVLTVIGISSVGVVLSIVSKVDVVAAYAAMTGAGIYLLLPLLVMTSLSVIVYFRRHPELSPGAWPALVAPVISAAALTALFVLVTRELKVLTVTGVGATIAMVAVVIVPLVGLLLALFYRAKRPEIYARIGNPLEE